MKFAFVVLLIASIVGAAESFAPLLPAARTSPLASSAQEEYSIEDWENDTYEIDEPIPTTVERFLKAKYPEFYFLLSKNEEILQNVVRRQPEDQGKPRGMGV